eukprot:11038625-Alexandrium_andersonii.AAC.1
MSASLVGSEMCIRDSPAGTPGKVSGYVDAPAPGGVPSPTFAGREGSWCCLLYTSDAADDM